MLWVHGPHLTCKQRSLDVSCRTEKSPIEETSDGFFSLSCWGTLAGPLQCWRVTSLEGVIPCCTENPHILTLNSLGCAEGLQQRGWKWRADIALAKWLKYTKGNVKRPFYIKMVVKGTTCYLLFSCTLWIWLAYQIVGFFTLNIFNSNFVFLKLKKDLVSTRFLICIRIWAGCCSSWRCPTQPRAFNDVCPFPVWGEPRDPQLPRCGHARWVAVPRWHGPAPGLAASSWQQARTEPSLEPEQWLRNGHTEDGTSSPLREGGGHQLLEGSSQEANGDGGVRTARTTDLLFSQYFFFFFLIVLFLLTTFSLKVTTGCKILSFRELTCGEVTRHFSSNFQTYSFFQLTNTPWSTRACYKLHCWTYFRANRKF